MNTNPSFNSTNLSIELPVVTGDNTGIQSSSMATQSVSGKNKKKVADRFIDFCAGIGAGRLGLEKNGLTCVGFSEIDAQAEVTYRKFFGDTEQNYGDLTKIDSKILPDFEMMIAGFPCQTFSVIGQRKGMKDERGQIIYGLIKIMLAKNLKYFILENVKGLTNHDNGNSFKVIHKELDRAGYKVYSQVLNSLDYGVPQMRERIYFVGIRKDLVPAGFEFFFPEKKQRMDLREYLINEQSTVFDKKTSAYSTFLQYLGNKYNRNRFNLSELLKKDYLVLDTRQSDLRVYENKVPTLRTGRHGIFYVKNGQLRKLSGLEALLLQGFPRRMAEKVTGKIEELHLLKQAGNAMTVSTIAAIAKELFASLTEYEK